jgi:hypothetical protein
MLCGPSTFQGNCEAAVSFSLLLVSMSEPFLFKSQKLAQEEKY